MNQTHVLVVATPPQQPDLRGEALKQTLHDDLHITVDEVRIASLYTIHSPLTRDDLDPARQTLFTDTVTHHSCRYDAP